MLPNNGTRWDMINWKIEAEKELKEKCSECNNPTKPNYCSNVCSYKLTPKEILKDV